MATAPPAASTRDPQAGALIRLRGLYPSLRVALQKVADVIAGQPEKTVYSSINEVAARAGVSEATVMRLCRVMGFKGFQDFKIALAREMATPYDSWQEPEDHQDPAISLVRKVFLANIASLRDTLEVLDGKAMTAAVQMLLDARRIITVGVGTSGAIAAYAGYRLLSLGFDAQCYTNVRLMTMGACLLTTKDVLLAVSHSGSSWEMVSCGRLARDNGAKVICITNNPMSPLTRVCDLVLVTANQEDPLGQPGIASRLCQVSTLDSLFALIYLARPEQIRENLEKMKKITSKPF